MATIVSNALNQFKQTVTRKRPTTDYNSSDQVIADYSSTTDLVMSVVIIKNHKTNEQTSLEGVREVFPAKLIAAEDSNIQDFDLIVTSDDIFQVKNSQNKANNFIGAVSSDPSYFYCDLTYYNNDTTL